MKNSINFPKTIVKKCKDCGEVKEHKWMSSLTCTGKPEYRARCNDCQLKYWREWRKGRRKQYAEYKRKCTEAKKLKAIEYLGGKCIVCGYNKSKRALTFHHRDRKSKEGTLAIMFQNCSWEKIKKELDKCDLVCFNHHMEIEEELEINQRNNILK